MRSMITPELLAERVLRTLNLSAKDKAESIIEILQTALNDSRDAAIAATKAAGIEIAEEEAEQSRSVGASAAQQTALNIATRIRKRSVEVRA